MDKPAGMLTYYDYLSPWCYIAAIRLQKMAEEYRDRIDIRWRSYPLVPGEIPNRRISPHSAVSRDRANQEEPGINFRPWDRRRTYPSSSMPAMQAAKCAHLQGEAVFQHLHFTLFRAFFEENQNIGQRKVLLGLTKRAGLDLKQFIADFDQGQQKNEVLSGLEEGWEKCSFWGIPFTLIGGRYPVMGASPIDMYRRAIDLCLTDKAGQNFTV